LASHAVFSFVSVLALVDDLERRVLPVEGERRVEVAHGSAMCVSSDVGGATT